MSYPIDANQSPDDMKDDLMFQLQKMFYYLNFSQKKSFSPDDWVYSYKDETGCKPVDVLQQQDAQFFLMTLSDRLEVINRKQNPNDETDFLKRTIQGKVVTQMIRESPPADDDSVSNREKYDTFPFITLTVKGFKCLDDSLVHYVQSEQISGILIIMLVAIIITITIITILLL
jgi:hypothetical protein